MSSEPRTPNFNRRRGYPEERRVGSTCEKHSANALAAGDSDRPARVTNVIGRETVGPVRRRNRARLCLIRAAALSGKMLMPRPASTSATAVPM